MAHREYQQWVRDNFRKHSKQQNLTPFEKAQGVTHPVGEETAEVLIEQFLKESGSSSGKALGKNLKVFGPLSDIFLSPKDAW